MALLLDPLHLKSSDYLFFEGRDDLFLTIIIVTVSLFAFGTLRDDIPFVRLEYSQSYVGIYDAESALGEEIVESCRIVELLFCQFMMQ